MAGAGARSAPRAHGGRPRRGQRQAHASAGGAGLRGDRHRARGRDAGRHRSRRARALDGTAEAMPLPDDSADAVTVGQAFHWFDGPAALAEIERVLRPGGALALAWNRRPSRVLGAARGDQRDHRALPRRRARPRQRRVARRLRRARAGRAASSSSPSASTPTGWRTASGPRASSPRSTTSSACRCWTACARSPPTGRSTSPTSASCTSGARRVDVDARGSGASRT